jgi:hypothetical protein
MSLALLEFFWTGSAPAPTPAPTPDPGSGGGSHGKGHGKGKGKLDPFYEGRVDDSFWDTREAYLRSIYAETLDEEPPLPVVEASPDIPPAPPPPVVVAFLPRYVAERAAAITALRLSENLTQLKANGARLIELNRTIALAKRVKTAEARRKFEQERQIRSNQRKQKLQALQEAGNLLIKTLTTLYRTPNS